MPRSQRGQCSPPPFATYCCGRRPNTSTSLPCHSSTLKRYTVPSHFLWRSCSGPSSRDCCCLPERIFPPVPRKPTPSRFRNDQLSRIVSAPPCHPWNTDFFVAKRSPSCRGRHWDVSPSISA